VAARRAPAVAPAHRLVAAPLAHRGEETLRHARQLQEASARFRRETPPDLPAQAWERSTAGASAIPAWWQAAGTTHRDRPSLRRGLVTRVVVHVPRERAAVPVALAWAGGARSHHEVIRPVRPSAQRRDVETRRRRMRAWRPGGATTAPLATTRHPEGCVPPQRARPCSNALVCQRCERQG